MPTRPAIGSWGPITIGLGSVGDIEMLDDAINDLRLLTTALSCASDEKWNQWMNATETTLKRSLWKEYDELWSEYLISDAWFKASLAARTFIEKGFRSQYLDAAEELEISALPETDISR